MTDRKDIRATDVAKDAISRATKGAFDLPRLPEEVLLDDVVTERETPRGAAQEIDAER